MALGGQLARAKWCLTTLEYSLKGHLEAAWSPFRSNRYPEVLESGQVELKRRPRAAKLSLRGAQES